MVREARPGLVVFGLPLPRTDNRKNVTYYLQECQITTISDLALFVMVILLHSEKRDIYDKKNKKI